MRSRIKIENYGEVELFKAESNLQEQGSRLVRKQSEKDLLPGEYIKKEFSSFLHSSGPLDFLRYSLGGSEIFASCGNFTLMAVIKF